MFKLIQVLLLFLSINGCLTFSPSSIHSPSITQLKSMSSPSTRSENEEVVVRNFRKAAKLERIYRCANTDALGKFYMKDEGSTLSDDAAKTPGSLDNDSAANIILNKAGLILDLRSSSERKEDQASAWMSEHQFQVLVHSRNENRKESSFNYKNNDALKRIVYRIDVLSPQRLFDYMAKNWINDSIQKASYTFNSIFDGQKLHEQRMDILNDKGIQGTYEAMLQTSDEELSSALKAITTYLENNSSGDVIVHCVQGKDRTGLVIMLCQSILGTDDDTIIEDYHKSEQFLRKKEESAAVVSVVNSKKPEKGKLNKSFFRVSPKEAMIETLAFIRREHGTLYNYLDFIGFDKSWRERFLRVANENYMGTRVSQPQSKL